MIKILITVFNSLFFFAIIFIFFQNLVVASIVFGTVCLITFFALSLATVAHNSNNLPAVRDHYLQPYQDSYQSVNLSVKGRDTSPILNSKKNLNKIPERKESIYWKSN